MKYAEYSKMMIAKEDNIKSALRLQKSLVDFVQRKIKNDLTGIRVSTIANMIEESKK